MRRFKPAEIVLVPAVLVIFILVAALLSRGGASDRTKPSNPPAAARRAEAQDRCAAQSTYDRIKLELFRSAAQTRGSDQQIFDRLSAFSAVRVVRPLLTARDEELGTLRCSGNLSIDLPPGTAVVGGRRTLTADIDYIIQPAADGSGDIVMLEGADRIVVPLATVARIAGPSVSPVATKQTELTEVTDEIAEGPLTDAISRPSDPVVEPKVREPVATPRAGLSSRPSFNCRYARTKSEIAVCSDNDLASLDRTMSSEFYRALASADARQRTQLTTTRNSFLRYRDRCDSDACIAEAYRGRLREIRDIMAVQ